jgi:hypothetical protein
VLRGIIFCVAFEGLSVGRCLYSGGSREVVVAVGASPLSVYKRELPYTATVPQDTHYLLSASHVATLGAGDRNATQRGAAYGVYLDDQSARVDAALAARHFFCDQLVGDDPPGPWISLPMRKTFAFRSVVACLAPPSLSLRLLTPSTPPSHPSFSSATCLYPPLALPPGSYILLSSASYTLYPPPPFPAPHVCVCVRARVGQQPRIGSAGTLTVGAEGRGFDDLLWKGNNLTVTGEQGEFLGTLFEDGEMDKSLQVPPYLSCRCLAGAPLLVLCAPLSPSGLRVQLGLWGLRQT